MLFIALFLAEFSFSQNFTVIDTAKQEFRKDLEVLYLKNGGQTAVYLKTVTDREIRKQLETIYKENQTSFSEKIKKGYFVDDYKYNNQINEILEKLKSVNPEIKNIKPLVEISNGCNAYNNGDDIIVLQLSLFSKLDNKYQLAFIMSHEIAHQLLDHVKKGTLKYVESSNSDKVKQLTRQIERQKYNKSESIKDLYKDLVYSNREVNRKNEMEADSLGFVLFNKAYPNENYQAIQALGILEDIDREKDSLTEKDYTLLFDSEKQPFKKQWVINDELSSYQYQKTSKFWAVDSLKTHPDCADRIALLEKRFISLKKLPVNSDFSGYSDLRINSKYDLIMGLFFLKDYGDSLYETLILLKTDSSNPFLRRMVYENLVQIHKAQNNYTLSKYLKTIDPKYSNSYNTYLFFIRKLRKMELQNIIEIFKNHL
jgi:hypothetical protein